MLSSPTALSFASVIAVSLLSLIGVFSFVMDESVIRRLIFPLVSFSTGALLGDVFLHIFPELNDATSSFPAQLQFVLGGILLSFIIEKFIHWQHCHSHGEPCDDHHHPVGVMSLIGDATHNFIDGALIAASFLVSVPVGFATAIAVALHEIPHEIGNFAILLYSGFGRRRAIFFNFLSGLVALLGVFAVVASHAVLPMVGQSLLPIAAGNLLYIASADLIPELHKERRFAHNVLQFFALLAGMGVMQLLKIVSI